MHITVFHNELLTALETVARISTKHLTLPILQCVQFEVKDKKLILRSTNLEIGVEATVDLIEQKKSGSVCVPAVITLQTISLLNQKEVTLVVEGDVLVVKTKQSHTSINAMTGEDFPTIHHLAGNGQKIKGKTFALGIKTAAFASSQSSIKPELGSVYVFQKKEQALTFVATDSFRLVEKTVSQQGVVVESGILIPYKNALELARICDVFDEDPLLCIDENQCALRFSNVYITSRLTAGTFPDYESIIPKEYSTHVTVLTADLQSALKKTNIFLNKFLRLTLSVSKNKLVCTSEGESGTAAEEISAAVEGGDITLNFNQRYVQEVLPHINDESTSIHFAGIGRPIVVEGIHDRSLRYLVMPMNK